jgi:glycosyltransferase involved in cell wall biosynthesis
MKIVFFQNIFCTRALKQAIALKDKVDLLIGVVSGQSLGRKMHQDLLGQAFHRTYTETASADTLANIVERERPHIIHCHNFPDTQANLAIEIRKQQPGIKVIHDIHDHGTLQYGSLSETQQAEEIFAERHADGIIFVSELACQAICKMRKTRQPALVLYSKPNLQYFPKAKFKKPGKKVLFVYEGGIHSAAAHHRNYIEPFTEITKHGHTIHIFTSTLFILEVSMAQKKIYHDYLAIHPRRIKVNSPLPIKKLYMAMTKYDAGISILSGQNTPYQQLTIPNKIFEYAACGLPTIVDNEFKAIRDYVVNNKMGIAVTDWNSFDPKALIPLRQYLQDIRENFSMEREIHKLVGFYRDILQNDKME